MRIALYNNLPSGGAKRSLLEWTKRLSKEHHIDVFTLSEADHEFCDLRPFVRDYHIFEFTPRRLFGSPVGRFNQLQRWRDLRDIEAIGANIADQINCGGYDLLFSNPCQRTSIPSFLPLVDIPTIHYLHEPISRNQSAGLARPYENSNTWRSKLDEIDPFIQLYRRRLETIRVASIARCDYLLANSAYTQKQMRLALGVEADICPIGVNLSDFRPLPNITKQPHVLSVGEMTPRKGFDFLIESLSAIPEHSRPLLRLVSNWIDPLERSYLEELATERNVTLDIRSRLNTEELAVEYNQARLCVYSPVAEPLGLVPLEAMACGTPVAGVAEAGVLETVLDGETGMLVPREPAAFAAAVEALFADEALYRKLSAQARPYVEAEWSWDKSTQQLETHFREAVGSVLDSAAAPANQEPDSPSYKTSPLSLGETP